MRNKKKTFSWIWGKCCWFYICLLIVITYYYIEVLVLGCVSGVTNLECKGWIWAVHTCLRTWGLEECVNVNINTTIFFLLLFLLSKILYLLYFVYLPFSGCWCQKYINALSLYLMVENANLSNSCMCIWFITKSQVDLLIVFSCVAKPIYPKYGDHFLYFGTIVPLECNGILLHLFNFFYYIYSMKWHLRYDMRWDSVWMIRIKFILDDSLVELCVI